MSLPPLPEELAAFAETQARHCALNDMVQAYGQQCREQALEEAAKLIESQSDQLMYTQAGNAIALVFAINVRSLK